MSRAYKDALVAEIVALGATGLTAARAETFSGYDLARMKNVLLAGGTVTVGSDLKVTFNENTNYPGDPNFAALTGADIAYNADGN